MSRIVWFEIPADDPARAAAFYEKAFGWKVQKWEGPMDYWMVTTGPNGEPGINGGMMRRPHPGAVTCNTIEVKSLEGSIASVEKAGGKVVVPKMPIQGIGWCAYCVDPEGNQFGLMQPDSSVK